ncbi:unnamed protein product [Clonostachys rosea f. rosea IK726]|uniref:Uncharacterized protein n=1 Tax=Clonostachys rosea f. rosea IK726 TaxID=1349383 RepID=A0ACA9T879_BIOOC|nr:unnamed protein product [Clonostachys rosea f. rosea IK726]
MRFSWGLAVGALSALLQSVGATDLPQTPDPAITQAPVPSSNWTAHVNVISNAVNPDAARCGGCCTVYVNSTFRETTIIYETKTVPTTITETCTVTVPTTVTVKVPTTVIVKVPTTVGVTVGVPTTVNKPTTIKATTTYTTTYTTSYPVTTTKTVNCRPGSTTSSPSYPTNVYGRTPPQPICDTITTTVWTTTTTTELLYTTVPTTVVVPTTIDNTVQVPTTVDNTVLVPTTVDNTVQVPTTVDNTVQVPTTVDNTVQVPTTIDRTSYITKTTATPTTVWQTTTFTETVERTATVTSGTTIFTTEYRTVTSSYPVVSWATSYITETFRTTLPGQVTTLPGSTSITTFTVTADGTTSVVTSTVTLPASTVTLPGSVTTLPGQVTTLPGTTSVTTLTVTADGTTSLITSTITLPASTVTLPASTITLPGQVTTLPGQTVTAPGATITAPAQTITLPGEVTTLPGSTVVTTATILGPERTITVTRDGSTIISTVPGPTSYVPTTITIPPVTVTVPPNTLTVTTITSVTLCPAPTATLASTYKPKSKLTFGCSPGYVCNPKKPDTCNFWPAPPANEYTCSYEDCIRSPPIKNVTWEGNQTGYYPPQFGYFNLNPNAFGLAYDIFEAEVIVKEKHGKLVTITTGNWASQTSISTFERSTSTAVPAVRRRLAKRDINTAPAICYSTCNNAYVLASSLGKSDELCDATGDFIAGYNACIKCITDNIGESQTTPRDIVDPEFGQFLNYCSGSNPITSTSVHFGANIYNCYIHILSKSDQRDSLHRVKLLVFKRLYNEQCYHERCQQLEFRCFLGIKLEQFQ